MVEAELRQVSGMVERAAAKDMIVRYSPGAKRITVGADKAFELHVIERIKLVDDGKVLEVVSWVDDPEAFYGPWSVVQRYDRIQRPLQEQICIEGNRNLFVWEGMPVAEKPDF